MSVLQTSGQASLCVAVLHPCDYHKRDAFRRSARLDRAA
jgi:hypothetical protein